MLLSFDGQAISSEKITGIGVYAKNIIAKLVSDYPDDQFRINIFSKEKILSTHIQELIGQYSNLSVEINTKYSLAEYKVRSIIFKTPYSSCFSASDATLFFNNVLYPGVQGVKAVVIHDMVALACPETMSLKTRLWVNSKLKYTVDASDILITTSNFSKKEINKYFPQTENRSIVIASPAVEVNESDYNVDYRLKHGEYFSYIGAIEPRKNIIGLLKGYRRYLDQTQTPCKLLIAGGVGWNSEDILKLVKSDAALGANVVFLGYIPDSEKYSLLKFSKAFLFLSSYEGFGIPPLEALAMDTPVVSSNADALVEVLGGSAIIVNPADANDVARGLREVLLVDKIAFHKKALDRVKYYSWDGSAKKIYTSIKEHI